METVVTIIVAALQISAVLFVVALVLWVLYAAMQALSGLVMLLRALLGVLLLPFSSPEVADGSQSPTSGTAKRG